MVGFFLALCVIVFGFTSYNGSGFTFFGAALQGPCLRWGALHPILVWNEPWRLLSAVFVHFGLMHLLMNMGALIAWGAPLERTLGSARFVITFVSTGVVGFVVSVAWSILGFGGMGLTAGASGGLFGLMSFEVGYLYKARNPAWKQALIRALLFTVFLGLMASINTAAHVGGGVAGALVGYVSYRERIWREYDRLWRGVAAILVLLSLASIALSHLSPTARAHRQARHQNGSMD